MSHNVTLGGDRLGSGNKQKVHLHGFERSTHDLSYIWRSTMAPGTLVPFMSVVGLPGDTFDIELQAHTNTHPTVGPLFGSFKLQYDLFLCPIRLYHSALHNNALGIGMKMNQIKLPTFDFLVRKTPSTIGDWDNLNTDPSSVLAHLGFRGAGFCIESEQMTYARSVNAVPLLSYYDIYKNYYSNKQEGYGVYIATVTEDQFCATPEIIEIVNSNKDTGQEFRMQIPLEPDFASGFRSAGLLEITFPTTVTDPTEIQPDNIVIKFWDGTYLSATQMTGGKGSVRFFSPAGKYIYTGPVLGIYSALEFKNWNFSTTLESIPLKPKLKTFPLENIDKMRELILAKPPLQMFRLNESNGLQPYDCNYTFMDFGNGRDWIGAQFNQQGLAIKTYQSDLFNNWLDTEVISGVGGINDITKIDTSQGFFNVDALLISRKVYDLLNRIAVSGGTYRDWLDSTYDHVAYTAPETPIYLGGLSKEIVFQEVINNAGTDAEPLGKLAGKGTLGNKHKGGKIVVKVNEPSYIIGIVSITPRIDYSQGNSWDYQLESLDDLHKPHLDQIGFQDLIAEQMAWWTTAKKPNQDALEFLSPGKQPAWINYMTAVNVVRGNFAVQNNEMFMVLNRRYESEIANSLGAIKDVTTYIDPVKYNNIFAVTSLDAQNFWVQTSVDIKARRKMSAKVMPNL